MANREAFAIIVNCLFIHLIFALDLPSYITHTMYPVSELIATNVGVGLSLLMFPLFGLLADVWFTRYLMIQVSSVFLAINLIIALIFSGFAITIFPLMDETHVSMVIVYTAFGVVLAIAVASIGLFEANAIQFGMDQLLEASSSQLSAFIHWYFWAMHLGQQVVFCAGIVSVLSIPATLLRQFSEYEETLVLRTAGIVLFLVWMSCIVTASFLLHRSRKHMYVAKTGINPFKEMWKVLNFAKKHKYPLNRSAFTYCEENTPSRLDLGKEQYGGPFTTEEVEDVKIFLRLLLLLVSLFGYHVAGDGFAVVQHMEQYHCPSLIVWGLITFNPASISSMVVLISIPLVKCLPKMYRLTPNMLKRMGIGLLILVMQDLVYTALIATYTPVVDNSLHENATDVIQCYYIRTSNNSSGNNLVDNIFLWLIAPQILNGLAQLLVHMTVLEFICAQAPRTMQGLLIGLWYAMFSIRYLLMSSLDHVFTSSLEMLVYQAVRSGLVLLSLVMYLCVSWVYQYRVRDWVVNVQWMVEDVFERTMEQEERYKRQERAEEQNLFCTSPSKHDYGSFTQYTGDVKEDGSHSSCMNEFRNEEHH